MILDKIRDGQFIFKNTYSENKKFTIRVDDPNSPDEFFFVHVELTDEKIAEVRQNQSSWVKIKSKLKSTFSSKK